MFFLLVVEMFGAWTLTSKTLKSIAKISTRYSSLTTGETWFSGSQLNFGHKMGRWFCMDSPFFPLPVLIIFFSFFILTCISFCTSLITCLFYFLFFMHSLPYKFISLHVFLAVSVNSYNHLTISCIIVLRILSTPSSHYVYHINAGSSILAPTSYCTPGLNRSNQL